MNSHPYTDARRMYDPYKIFESLVSRGVPSSDPSFEPWEDRVERRHATVRFALDDRAVTVEEPSSTVEHTDPAITRARIADGRITSARTADARVTSAMRNVTIRDMADIAHVVDRPAWGEPCRWIFTEALTMRAPQFEEQIWCITYCNGRVDQFKGGVGELHRRLLDADSRGLTIGGALRNHVKVHIEFSETAITVARRGDDGVVAVLDAREFY
jgi:hypothetical protein